MQAAEGRPANSLAALAVGLALALGGCAAPRACYCRDASPAGGETTSAYTVAAPDVLELAIASRPDRAVRATIEPDGAVTFGPDARLRVEGLLVSEIKERVAAELRVPPSEIQIHIPEYASRHLFLCGPVAGTERAVPYQGPETVVQFLHRVGGLSRDAEPRDVHVVRANVAAGRRPEVFPVDLKAITIEKDNKTNVLLQPYDQVYIGESARATWERCLPPWLQIGMRQPVRAGSVSEGESQNRR